MEDLLGLLLKNGAFGILAAAGFYLYLRERKIVQDTSQHDQAQQVAETKAKVRLTHTLEDLVETVQAVGANSKNDMGVCQGRVGVLIDDVRSLLDDLRIERAREEGRKEVTDRIILPTEGGKHEPR